MARISDIEGIGEGYAAKLDEAGVGTVDQHILKAVGRRTVNVDRSGQRAGNLHRLTGGEDQAGVARALDAEAKRGAGRRADEELASGREPGLSSRRA